MDVELKGKEELQINLIRFAKCIINELRLDLYEHQIKYLFFFWNVMTGIDSFSFDITEFCVTWRELLHIPEFNNNTKYYLDFKYDKKFDAWKASSI